MDIVIHVEFFGVLERSIARMIFVWRCHFECLSLYKGHDKVFFPGRAPV